MVLKALYYFLCTFFIIVVALIAQDPYSIDLTNDKEEIATVEFFDVQDYLINESGISMKISASRAEHYFDKNILYNINALIIKNNIVETLASNIGLLRDNIVYLDGNVIYTRGNQTVLKSESVEYHEKSAELIGKKPFTLDDKGFGAKGNSFLYDTKKGNIKVQSIVAKIKVEEKWKN